MSSEGNYEEAAHEDGLLSGIDSPSTKAQDPSVCRTNVFLGHCVMTATDSQDRQERHVHLLQCSFGTEAKRLSTEERTTILKDVIGTAEKGLVTYFHSRYEEEGLGDYVYGNAEAAGWEDFLHTAAQEIEKRRPDLRITNKRMDEMDVRRFRQDLSRRKPSSFSDTGSLKLRAVLVEKGGPLVDPHWQKAKAAITQDLDLSVVQLWHEEYTSEQGQSSYWFAPLLEQDSSTNDAIVATQE